MQFGLHATSVHEHLDKIVLTDPRIRIVWEDCGAFPFSYYPREVENFDETVDFMKKILHLRGEKECFGAVTKGLTLLNWGAFTHPDAARVVGISSAYMKKNREARRIDTWHSLQALWLGYADKALEMLRLMGEEKKGDAYISALVEDGMFDTQVMYPAALYAEMLWNVHAELRTLMTDVALRPYVTFA